MVKKACDHFKIPQMADVQIKRFQIMNTIMLITIDVNNFHYIGAIPDVMLDKVPPNNEIIAFYRQISKLGEFHMSPSMQAALEVGNVQR